MGALPPAGGLRAPAVLLSTRRPRQGETVVVLVAVPRAPPGPRHAARRALAALGVPPVLVSLAGRPVPVFPRPPAPGAGAGGAGGAGGGGRGRGRGRGRGGGRGRARGLARPGPDDPADGARPARALRGAPVGPPRPPRARRAAGARAGLPLRAGGAARRYAPPEPGRRARGGFGGGPEPGPLAPGADPGAALGALPAVPRARRGAGHDRLRGAARVRARGRRAPGGLLPPRGGLRLLPREPRGGARGGARLPRGPRGR